MADFLNPSELAALMLEWEQAQRKADQLKAQIESAVMNIGATQQVGNVKATYSKGRMSYDYEAAANNHLEEVMLSFDVSKIATAKAIVDAFTTTKTSTSWREACEAMEISKSAIPFSQSEPSVSLKLYEA